jgi:hypothetical protein
MHLFTDFAVLKALMPLLCSSFLAVLKLAATSGPMSFFWWQSGCTREAIEVLQHLRLSKCFDTTQDLIESVADHCIEDARVMARAPEGCMVNWDNINMSASIFVEQRNSAPAKVHWHRHHSSSTSKHETTRNAPRSSTGAPRPLPI